MMISYGKGCQPVSQCLEASYCTLLSSAGLGTTPALDDMHCWMLLLLGGLQVVYRTLS